MEMKEMEDVVRLATKISFGMVKELLEDKTETVSRHKAEKKYGKQLIWEWEHRKLLTARHTDNGKHDVFPKHRLIELYEMHTFQI